MFRTFADGRSLDQSSDEDNRRKQNIFTSKGQQLYSNYGIRSLYHGNNDDIRIVRDRTTETQTTAGESQVTVSSLSGIFSSDLINNVYALSGSESESENDAHNDTSDYRVKLSNDRILLDAVPRDMGDIVDQVDLDAASESTTVVSNQFTSTYPIPYLSSLSVPAIVKNSSWVDDRPFDEESIMNMSDVGDGALPSYYQNNVMPVKEYILPPPPPVPSRRTSSRHVDEIIEISPYMATETSQGRVAWGGNMIDQGSSCVASSADGSVYFSEGVEASLEQTKSAMSTKERSPTTEKERRSQIWRCCMVTGCCVTLMFIIIIVVFVVLSNKNNGYTHGLSTSEVQNSQTAAPTAEESFLEISVPTNATTVPSDAMTVATESPSKNHTESVPWLDGGTPSLSENPMERATMAPTLEPTSEPTREPNPKPTLRPTTDPTESPTENPTLTPTLFPSTAMPTALLPPTCTSRISVAQDCFFMSEKVLTIDFENCSPQKSDWVALYPDGSEVREERSEVEFLSDNWLAWAWSCGDQSCDFSPNSNKFAFAVDADDPSYTLFNLRAYLVRSSNNGGPPYEIIAKSEPFAITAPCNP